MHKFCHSGAKPFLQEKLGVLREIVSKTNFPDDSHVLLTQEKRLTNSGLWYLWKIFYENHCNDDAQISPHWGEAIFRRRIESFVKNCSQNQSPRWVTCLLTQEKSLTNAVIVISVENIYKTAVLKTHKFCHFWKENCEFCEQMYSSPTSQTSPMLTHTGEKLYKRRNVTYVENIFPNHWPEDAQI